MSWSDLLKPCKTEPKLAFYDSVNLIDANHWEKATPDKNIYLTLPYLKSLEDALKDQIDFRYILFYDDDFNPIAAAYVQIVRFEDKGNPYVDMIGGFGDKIKNKLKSLLDFKVMVCGNVFATGENGFSYNEALSDEDAYNHLTNALNRLRRSIKIDFNLSVILVKDFWSSSIQKEAQLKQADFRPFEIDVNMVLDIDSDWETFDDYLNDMNTKSRTKAKGVFKKSENLVVKNLNLFEIEKHQEKTEELYKNVLANSDFRFGMLNGKCFVELKRNLGDHFLVKGYFLKDKLVGFSAAFICRKFVDANYVGIDYTLNKEHAIYQRMLYDYTDLAINCKTSSLRFGRTAELIKSSLGALPVGMKLYIKHKNVVTNQLIKPIIDKIKPSEFELRKPFKVELSSK